MPPLLRTICFYKKENQDVSLKSPCHDTSHAYLQDFFPVYIQLSEKQQLGLERRFLIQRYSVIEREKWQTKETLSRGVYGGYTPRHTNGKEKYGTTRNIEGLHKSVNDVLSWRMEVSYLTGSRFSSWQL